MVLTPVCLVQDGISGYFPTDNGSDVTPGGTVSIKLATPVGPTAWFLEIFGTDVLTAPYPTLTGVNVLTHQVATPSTTVTFTFPNDLGRAIGFRSTVQGVGGPISTSFGIYSLTAYGTRVGFVTETREGNTEFGWASKLNPIIRSSGNSGPNNYSLIEITDSQTIPDGQQMLYVGEILIDEEGELVVEGEVANVDHHENFSVLYVPPNTERVVRENDEMLYTSSMVVDGQLTVNGQITDVTPIPTPPSSGVTAYCHWYNDNDLGMTTNGADVWSDLPNSLSTDSIAVDITRTPGTTEFVVTYAGTYAVDVQMSWFSSSSSPDWLAVRAVRAQDGEVMAQRASYTGTATGAFNDLGTVTLHGLVEIFTDGDTIRIEYCQPTNGGVGTSMPTFGGTAGRHTTITIYRIGDALGDPPLA